MKAKINIIVLSVMMYTCFLFAGIKQFHKPAIYILECSSFYDTYDRVNHLVAYSIDGVVYQTMFNSIEGVERYLEYLRKIGKEVTQ